MSAVLNCCLDNVNKEKVKCSFLEKQTVNDHETRVVCAICFHPRLRMVTGFCQHKFCETCLYEATTLQLKPSFNRCPTCQKKNVFPQIRPDIPEDSIYIQQSMGVAMCQTPGCNEEMWEWELPEHQKECQLQYTNNMKLAKQEEERKMRYQQRSWNRPMYDPYRSNGYFPRIAPGMHGGHQSRYEQPHQWNDGTNQWNDGAPQWWNSRVRYNYYPYFKTNG